MDSGSKGTIRFEDLGEPVQRLLKSLKADVSEEDMTLLEYVSVKDMAKIFVEMSSDRHAEEIWKELREALQARKDKALREEAELCERHLLLQNELQQSNDLQRAQEEEDERERLKAERELEQRKDARRQQLEADRLAAAEEAASAAAAAALAEQEAAEAAEAQAQDDERRKKAEKRRKRREAREQELRRQQELLEEERSRHHAKKLTDQKNEWASYVSSHPLEFSAAPDVPDYIKQEPIRHILNAPPSAPDALLRRTYTPKCPYCGITMGLPPREWNCPQCLRRYDERIKMWQPDDQSDRCLLCGSPIGRWSRHHCRNCGRLTCSRCCTARATIPSLGYTAPVKVCSDCAISTVTRT